MMSVSSWYLEILVAAVFGADADADAGHGANHRNARVHQRQRAAANVAIEVEPLDSMISLVTRMV
jgi:hypothetical protein